MAARVVGGVPVSVSHEAPSRGPVRPPPHGPARRRPPRAGAGGHGHGHRLRRRARPRARVGSHWSGAAVLAGQLTIGWSNDLIDLRRDREVARTDKPLATGAVSVRMVRTACAVTVVAGPRAVAGLRAGGGRGPPRSGRRRLGLQPRPQGDRALVAPLRRRLRRVAGLRAPRGRRRPARRRDPGRDGAARRRCPPAQRPARPRRRRGHRRRRSPPPARRPLDPAGRRVGSPRPR